MLRVSAGLRCVRMIKMTQDTNLTAPDRALSHPRIYWDALNLLARCRVEFGLPAASITVLRALISFLPKEPASDLQRAIVWPSNAALMQRADGMQERTLRRHLARLEAAGFITRKISANGKRFALRLRSEIVTAFGFDLTPLVRALPHIAEIADTARQRDEHIRLLRCRIRALVYRFSTENHTEAAASILPEILRLLRRNCDIADLIAAEDALRNLLPADPDSADTSKMSATDSQNDRHIQRTEKDSYLSVSAENTESMSAPCPDGSGRPEDKDARSDMTTAQNADADVTLEACLNATQEAQSFSPDPVTSWPDLICLADRLAPMLAIAPDLYAQARRSMGVVTAAISVLCIIERGDAIRRPAAYLRRLTQKAEAGEFSLKGLLRARQQRLAA